MSYNKKSNFEKSRNSKKELITYIDDNVIIDTILEKGGTKFCIYNRQEKTFNYAKEVVLNGFKYKNFSASHGLIKSGSIVFPSAITDYENKDKLLLDLVDYIYKYVDVPDEYVYISAYYIMLTYLYQNFTELPYLRVLGDYGSGKSRLLKVIGNVCFNPIMLGGGASLASIFRLIDKFKGTLIIDEADFSNSGTTEGIIKVLNTGYQKGNPIMRIEGDDNEISCFDVFGPKVIGGRNEFSDKATESRCLTNLMKRSDREDIPTSLDDEFFNEALVLRNKLLKFRYDYIDIAKIDNTIELGSIEPRLKQITIPMLSIIEDKSMHEMIIDFINKKQNEIREDRKNDIFGGVLTILFYSLDGLSDITYSRIIEELQKSDGNILKPQRLGYLLKENGIKTTRRSEGKIIRYDDNKDVLDRLYKEYNIFCSCEENIESNEYIVSKNLTSSS